MEAAPTSVICLPVWNWSSPAPHRVRLSASSLHNHAWNPGSSSRWGSSAQGHWLGSHQETPRCFAQLLKCLTGDLAPELLIQTLCPLITTALGNTRRDQGSFLFLINNTHTHRRQLTQGERNLRKLNVISQAKLRLYPRKFKSDRETRTEVQPALEWAVRIHLSSRQAGGTLRKEPAKGRMKGPPPCCLICSVRQAHPTF